DDAGFLGSRNAPSSAVPIILSGPRRLNEKSPLRSALVGRRALNSSARRIYFHSIPPKKKNLFLMIGPPVFHPKLLYRKTGFGRLRELLVKRLASRASLRRYSHALP